jgi:hypothetical protein
MAAITNASEGYIAGFFACSSTAHLRIAIGTNNANGMSYGSHIDFGYVTREHGAAWGQMVNALNAYINSQNYAARVSARGASDIEIGFGPPEQAIAWVDGYSSVSSWPMYNFGSADGCPVPSGNVFKTGTCSSRGDAGSPAQVWTQDQLWYVSYGNPVAYPLPEIYCSVSAKQWYNESLYGALYKTGRLDFLGTTASYGPVPGCTPLTPAESFMALQDALNADSRTSLPNSGTRTGQPLSYSTAF